MAYEVVIFDHSTEGAAIAGTTDEVVLYTADTKEACVTWMNNVCNNPDQWPYDGAWEPTKHGNMNVRETS